MKKAETQTKKESVSPVFPVVIRQRGAKPVMPGSKTAPREKKFSKSRDTREDRGARQMKTVSNPQTFSHGK